MVNPIRISRISRSNGFAGTSVPSRFVARPFKFRHVRPGAAHEQSRIDRADLRGFFFSLTAAQPKEQEDA